MCIENCLYFWLESIGKSWGIFGEYYKLTQPFVGIHFSHHANKSCPVGASLANSSDISVLLLALSQIGDCYGSNLLYLFPKSRVRIGWF